MVLIDFQRTGDLSGAVPVRLRIAGVELLDLGPDEPSLSASSEGRWLPLPLMEVATEGLLCLRQARRTGYCALELDEFPEGLLFRMDGKDVLVHAGLAEKTVRVPFETLLEAWSAFAECVQAALVSQMPALRAHPHWQRLTEDPNGASTADWWEHNWRVLVDGHEHCFDRIDAVEQ